MVNMSATSARVSPASLATRLIASSRAVPEDQALPATVLGSVRSVNVSNPPDAEGAPSEWATTE